MKKFYLIQVTNDDVTLYSFEAKDWSEAWEIVDAELARNDSMDVLLDRNDLESLYEQIQRALKEK